MMVATWFRCAAASRLLVLHQPAASMMIPGTRARQRSALPKRMMVLISIGPSTRGSHSVADAPNLQALSKFNEDTYFRLQEQTMVEERAVKEALMAWSRQSEVLQPSLFFWYFVFERHTHYFLGMLLEPIRCTSMIDPPPPSSSSFSCPRPTPSNVQLTFPLSLSLATNYKYHVYCFLKYCLHILIHTVR